MREKLLGYMAWAKTSSAPLNLHAEALSDSVGTLRFVVDAINPALSHIVNAWDNVEKLTSAGSQIIEVDVVTLDSILPGIAPAFMKFDLEGADFLGLRGARDSIVRGHPIIFFESLMDRAAKMYGYTKEEFLAFFDGIGYDIYSLHGFPLTPDIWGSDDYGYESIALPRGAEISREVLDLTNFFWAEIGNKPEIENWNESTAILRAVFGWIEARP
jgi:FkbM family methyltransferase